jgi:hypothetical protein
MAYMALTIMSTRAILIAAALCLATTAARAPTISGPSRHPDARTAEAAAVVQFNLDEEQRKRLVVQASD